jgi:LDH2 family malate/lactate/ureidoglycolate dehydrogenase
MVWVGGFAAITPLAVPHGGAKAVLHTNPIAIGFPCGDEHPVVIDYATSAASSVKVVLAHQRGEQVPPGWIVDKDGQATTDPNEFFDGGSHVPFGGHKGYALMLAAEIFARIVPGTDAFADDRYGAPGVRHQGATMFVMKADLFRPLEDYSRELGALEQKIRSVPPAPGFENVRIPGDRGAATRASRRREGIPIPDDTWGAICETAESLGVEI